MKHVLLMTAVLVASAMGFADSLESHFAKQKIEKISPVRIDGAALSGVDDVAATVCYSLGFTRLVSVEKEACVSGEKLLHGMQAGAAVFWSEATCGISDDDSIRLASVTCAK